MRVKLLLDEDLSPWAAAQLRDAGIDAVHVRDRGALGQTDSEVLALAYGEDRTLVTANVGDFVKLASSAELHAGIALILQGDLVRAEQLRCIRQLLDWLALQHGDLINRVVYVDGADMTIEVLPKP